MKSVLFTTKSQIFGSISSTWDSNKYGLSEQQTENAEVYFDE